MTTSQTTIKSRIKRVACWLFVLSFVATLFVGLIRYPIERTAVDPSASSQVSDHVSVRGLPHFYFVSEPSVAHHPPASLLVRHFALDWFTFLVIFTTPVVGFEVIRITAFLAARAVLARRQRRLSH